MKEIPARFAPILQAIRHGDLPPRVAYMRLAMEAANPEELASLLLDGSPELAAVAAIAAHNPDGWTIVRGILAAVSHDRVTDGEDRVSEIAAMFDRAATLSPEASVALYSLGDAAALTAATAEIVAWLDGQNLLGPEIRLLDFGCGIGRLETALADRLNSIVGIDVSAAMVAEAARRCQKLDNVTIAPTSGRDLAGFPDAAFELVVALDSFPYVVAAGGDLPLRLLHEFGRILVPGGSLLVLNYSYGSDLEQNRRELSALGGEAGLSMRLAGEQPFALWDGAAFHLAKPS